MSFLFVQGKRNDNTFVDVASAQADAQNLLQAGNQLYYKQIYMKYLFVCV